MDFRRPTTLGRTGLAVGRLGIGASYGVPASAIERAFHEHGVNLFYWGSLRRGGMGDAIRHLAPAARDRIVVALQSYDRSGFLMRRFVERGLRKLGLDRADLLILGWHGSEPAARVRDAALRLVGEGKVRFLCVSGHHRPLFGRLARDPGSPYDVLMFRYNAAHRGAEREIFPLVPAEGGPGTIAFTATRWGQLLAPAKMPPGERPLRGSDCYRFALSRPEVDVCLAGPADAGEMEEALHALALGPLDEEELARARRIGDFVHG